MSRGELMERLVSRGVDRAERLCGDLSDEAIEGAIRWYDSKLTFPNKVTPGLLAQKLIEGGYAGFGKQKPIERPWYCDEHKRAAWCDRYFPDHVDEAEAAVISLSLTNRTITPQTVAATIRFDRQMDRDFYGGGHFETRIAEGKPGQSWPSHAVRVPPALREAA